MDFSTSFYDSTVEGNYYPPAPTHSIITAAELSVFMLEILAIKQLEPLCQQYFDFVSKCVGVLSVTMYQGNNKKTIGHSLMAAGNNVEFVMPGQTDTSETSDTQQVASYALLESLSPEQYQWLARLHQLFAQQYANITEQLKFESAATKDALTGLGNRSGFDEALKRCISHASRHNLPFSLIVIDLDNFKYVNDKYGHSQGDRVLTQAAALINTALRSEDQAFRFGGDEFCCLVTCQNHEQLTITAARLHRAFNTCGALQKYGISASFGGAIYQYGDTVQTLFDRADKALYQAKEAGKNTFNAA